MLLSALQGPLASNLCVEEYLLHFSLSVVKWAEDKQQLLRVFVPAYRTELSQTSEFDLWRAAFENPSNKAVSSFRHCV
jgi:hypothetical protein